ncbi:hypothetical protein [Orenia marismortui]|uniref:Uncharacterized protein n=1 Tax=Orenia marismortui TaxID=46469 RepID=A0A4R8H3I3_9FIRM|nr:hypothetical protein [Orenia marismortui]TDX53320.1 hypothetical protein C7959_103173 [Orenia marismortui]
MENKNVKYARLTGHEKRKLEDMEIAMNLDRKEEDKVIILAVEDNN